METPENTQNYTILGMELSQDDTWRKGLQKKLKKQQPMELSGDLGSEDPYLFEIVPEEESKEEESGGEDEDDSEDSEEEEEESNEEANEKQDSSPEESVAVEKALKRKSSSKEPKLKKRRKKTNQERRNIKKIFEEGQLDPQTLEAQMEERERLKRLELQKSLQKASAAALSMEKVARMFKSDAGGSATASPVMVDATSATKKDKQDSIVVISDDEDTVKDEEQETLGSKFDEDKDVIALLTSSEESSDSESEDEGDEYMDAHMNDDLNVRTSKGDVLINVSHPADEADIFIAPQIARALQPHQIGGIRFLYDNLIESIKRANAPSGVGFGCILAHSMGLGKTVQTIAFIDVFLRYTSAKKVLCVVPINTILNWVNEFNMWVPQEEKTEETSKQAESKKTENAEGGNPCSSESVFSLLPNQEEMKSEEKCSGMEDRVQPRNYEVFSLTDAQKTTIARGKVIGMWHQRGGVLLMGYEIYRIIALYQPSMCNSIALTKGKKKKQKEKKPVTIDVDEEDKEMHLLLGMQRAICKPGPDLVICDEGHRIKNFQSNISQALHKIKTRRRLVLTGYPLQNNLIEYWCMVDFVRPNYLGTRGEFSNMFERPIMNGQCLDSTPKDKKLMRYRAHVLNSLLKGFVQRRDHGVLRDVFPVKEERVLMIRLSDAQQKLYRKFISLCLEVYREALNPIRLFAICCKIWNHPDILHTAMLEQTAENPEVLLDTDDDIAGLSNSASTNKKKPSSDVSSALAASYSNDSVTKALLNSVKHWATEVYSTMSYATEVLENSGKFVILTEIIHETLAQGDKLLIFSQSLLTLDLIEKFLGKMQVPCYESLEGMSIGAERYWTKNKDYYRLDGRTVSSEREKLIRNFNDPTKNAKLFLLSTRAGCLGINLTGANRVVVFDVSWNPCHDAQAVCRVYRYGQTKQCHIYRLVASNTMEQRMYYRQISKQGISDRVVDELNPSENFTKDEMHTLISTVWETEPDIDFTDDVRASEDPVMKKVLSNCGKWIVKSPFQHESLLEDQTRNRLSRSEKKMARLAYENEKRVSSGFNIYDNVQGRNRSEDRPVVIVPPFIQNQPPPPAQPGLSTHERLALVNSYLRQVYSMNKTPYQAGATFNRNMFNAGLSENPYLAGTMASDFSTSSAFHPVADSLASIVDVSAIRDNATAVRSANYETSTVSRVPGTAPKYEPYHPSATASSTPCAVNQDAVGSDLNLGGLSSFRNDTVNTASNQVDLLSTIESSLSNMANTLLNYRQLEASRRLASSSSSACKVTQDEEVIVIDGDD